MKKISTIKIMGNDLNLYENGGERYLLANEIVEIIEYSKSNISKLIKKVDEEEKTLACVRTKSTSTKARDQKQWFVTIDGMRELLFQSTKPKAKQFKKEVKRVLKELDKNGYYVATEKDQQWLGIREDSKINRKEETDEIKKFVEYAKEKGSNSADKYYIHFSKLANKYAGIKNRDDATQQQLIEVIVAENLIKKYLPKLVAKDMPYKQVYQIIKSKLDELI